MLTMLNKHHFYCTTLSENSIQSNVYEFVYNMFTAVLFNG